MSGHLEFYREHGISPVAYSGTREQHFERRASLYRSLRLPPLAFRGARVLEVAAGTGQNAAYLESLGPRTLHLIEPNARGWSAPHLHVCRFEDYQSVYPFDIVICENWIGLPELEAGLLDKLAGLVAKDGVLVLTCVHPQGFYPNRLRRLIAARLVNEAMSFEEKTALLVRAFETHLATLKDMTRSPRDWVQDMLLNPAVDGIVLTFRMLIDRLGKDFTVLGTSPEFAPEWRWFKALHGAARDFNSRALSCYHWAEPDFADCRGTTPVYTAKGIAEAEALLKRKTFTAEDVRAMGVFSGLFGRETIFCSWQRN